MNDTLRELLIDYLDGSLPPSQRAEVDELISADPEAARFVSEHEQVWDALGEAFGDPEVEASEDFRAEVASRAAGSQVTRAWPLQRLLGLAACLAIGLTLFSWWISDRQGAPLLSAEDAEVVRYLHVLREFDVIESMSDELDLRAQYDVLRAFEGELEG
jgi:anti-sigma factor RsiW